MPSTCSPGALGFLPFATAALDFHRALDVPGQTLVVARGELDALHAHLIALHSLLDAYAARTLPLLAVEGEQLQAARTRIWQAADRLHAAYHAAPRPATGQLSKGAPHVAELPEGAPELTICQRHQRATRLARRRTTPAELRTPPPGRIHR